MASIARQDGRLSAPVTVLRDPGFPARTAPRPVSAATRLAIDADIARLEREVSALLDAEEAALAPHEAQGFAARFAEQFDERAARTLASRPAAYRPVLAEGVSELRDAVLGRAGEYERLAQRVHLFNTGKGLLDDLAAGVARDRTAFARVRDRGLAHIAAMPVPEPAKGLLARSFLADLPLKLAEAHIADDPADAARALSSGSHPEYADLAPEQRRGLAARAEQEAARRRIADERLLVERLELAVEEDRVGAADIAASDLGEADKACLIRRLEERAAEQARIAEILNEYADGTARYDPDDPESRLKVDVVFEELGGTAEKLAVGDPETVALVRDIQRRTGLVPETVLMTLAILSADGDDERQAFARELLNELGVGAEVVSTPVDDPAQAGPLPAEDGEESSWTWVDALDLVTDFIPVVSEVKAAGQLAYLAVELKAALEAGDHDRAQRITGQIAIAASDLLPGPSVARIGAMVAKLLEMFPAAARAVRSFFARRRKGNRQQDPAAGKPDQPGDTPDQPGGKPDREGGKEDPKEVIARNRVRGAEFEEYVFSRISRHYVAAMTQVTIVTKNGYRLRLDIAVLRRDGTIGFVEVKSGGGTLSRNQREGFADLRRYGGELRVADNGPFRRGMQLPPTVVRLISEKRLNEVRLEHLKKRREGAGRGT